MQGVEGARAKERPAKERWRLVEANASQEGGKRGESPAEGQRQWAGRGEGTSEDTCRLQMGVGGYIDATRKEPLGDGECTPCLNCF